MLRKPEVGIGRSVTQHNVKLDVMCDWIEGSLLFGADDELSTIDVVDVLLEEHVYMKQDFANEMLQNAWAELKRRHTYLGTAAPFRFISSRIECDSDWRDYPAYSFCLLLSLAKWYPNWAKQFGNDFTVQGELFEHITKASLEKQFPTWKMHVTGWSRTTPNKLVDVVNTVAQHLGEIKGSLELWAEPDANEAGLDVLCYRPFLDARTGIPVYLIQCASGGNWQEKVHAPDLKLWTKVIQFAATPRKGFSIPFTLLDSDFRRSCNLVDGLLLDRIRLLSATFDADETWISPTLKAQIINWAEPRVAALEYY